MYEKQTELTIYELPMSIIKGTNDYMSTCRHIETSYPSLMITKNGASHIINPETYESLTSFFDC